MQLHRLKLAAIGPFAEPVDIDLDRLSASGIFLLEGPTGAGKSTLIDAIVFALYGEVAGRASSTDRMASAVAAPDVTPSVELDFSTSHGMFRVQRTPKHRRRKRRGAGDTIEHASAKLWRLVSPDSADAGEPVSTRIDEIGAEIVDVIGLSREQFVQTVVLPQGEFATFLSADAEHRRALLQKLFGTEIYDQTMDRLVGLRRQAHQQRSHAGMSVLGAVRAYCGASGRSREEDDTLTDLLESDPEQLLVVVQQQLDALQAVAALAAEAATTATHAAELARADLTERQRREGARLRVLALRTRLAALDETADQLDADAVRLDRADEAASLMPTITGLHEARRRADEAQVALNAARAQLPRADVAAREWAEREREASGTVVELTPVIEVERQLDAARAGVDQLVEQRAATEQQRVAANQRVADAPAVIEALRGQLTRATTLNAGLQHATESLETAQRVLHAVVALEHLSAEVQEAKRSRAEARRVAQKRLKQEASLRSRFIDCMAGQLAAELTPDTACPVCGSLEHPNPAALADPDVDRAAVERAEEQAAQAMAVLEAAADRLAELETAIAEQRGIAGDIAAAEARERVEATKAAVDASISAGNDVARLTEALTKADAELAQYRETVQQLDTDGIRMDATIASTRESLLDGEQRVREAAGDHHSVSDRVAALTAEAAAWKAAVAALGPASAGADDVKVRTQELGAAMAASSFHDQLEVEAASLGDADRSALRESVQERRDERTRCEAELRSPELVDIDTDEQIDVGTATSEAAVAEDCLQEAQAARARLEQRVSESQARADEIQTALSAQRAVDVATAAVIRMADLASAGSPDNAKAMSLPTFVLRERFVEVVASANHRLATMSDGRYLLEHVEDKRGNRKSGLELQVRDTHTEHPRSPATLSGGETFYCSLALALGLADVVTSEAGGVDLGTLFVDEGFGSLDPDTLDQVLEVLQGLATSGRAVGIVSHVPELKEQIAERISVVPNRDGSSRLIVAA